MSLDAIHAPRPADDTLEGVIEIAAHLGKTERQVFYLCETGQIPAFKLGKKWHLRKSTYDRHIVDLEAKGVRGDAA
jgi:hypothetical protein